jgi:hypothetical protein
MIIMNKRFVVAALMMMAVSSPLAFAQKQTADATVDFSGGAVAAGIGYSWGSGVLHFQGKDYPFTVGGLSVVDVGASSVTGSGEVFNLNNVADFAGNYAAAGAGATIAGGGSVAVLENQNGVVVHFHSTTQGLRLHLSGAGVSIKLSQ